MIKEAIVKIVSKEDLTYDEAYAVMNEIMSGETTATQNAAFLAALSTKSTKAETIDEIAGCAAAMRDHATKVDTGMDIVEIVGTGGDGAQSFNILGPLTNPASPKTQLLGVYDEYLVAPLAQVLISLGVTRGMVVYGQDKLDEISLSAPTSVCEIKDGWYRAYTLQPEDFGFARCEKADLVGGSPAENAAITKAILSGQEKGHKRNAVLLNAGAALYLDGKAETMAEGVKLAARLIDSGAAMQTLEKLIEVSNRPEADA